MAVETPPGVLDGPETPAASTGAIVQRHTTSALTGSVAGVCGAAELAVTQSSTPAMTVRVAAGYALVNGSTTTYQGTYSFHNNAVVDNLAIAAGDPTNPRNDIVVAQIRDATYTGSDKDARLFVVQGTPGAVPADPSLPASCLALARVRVDANESTSILNADITDLRVFSGPWAAGMFVCQARTTTTQSITNATATAVTLGTEDLDPLGWHSTSVNASRITPTTRGWYQASALTVWGADTDYTTISAEIRRNGSALTPNAYTNSSNTGGGGNTPAAAVTSGLILMDGVSDYVELYVRQTNSNSGAETVAASLMLQMVYPATT